MCCQGVVVLGFYVFAPPRGETASAVPRGWIVLPLWSGEAMGATAQPRNRRGLVPLSRAVLDGQVLAGCFLSQPQPGHHVDRAEVLPGSGWTSSTGRVSPLMVASL